MSENRPFHPVTAPFPSLAVGLFPPEVVLREARPELLLDDLYPDEREHVRRAVAKRQAEFATARVCARQALAELGVAPMSLVPNPDRSPRWPEGVVGSISHTLGYCAVVVARSPPIRSVGLDAEGDSPLDRALERRVCTAGERRWLDRQPEDRRGWLAKLIFSAKEAYYKCQYPLTQEFLGFDDVELDLDLERRRFQARLLKEMDSRYAAVKQLEGKFERSQGLVLSGCTLR